MPLCMKRTIIISGHGPGISDAVARRFGREGHPVALVARNGDRLLAAAKTLSDAGINAKAFPCDLSKPDAVARMVGEIRGALGPIGILHWNAYTAGAGDLATANLDELRTTLDVAVVGMIAAVQEALPDLRAEKGSVLVTGGGFAFYDPRVDAMAMQFGAMGVAIGNAAQKKAVGLLHQRLKPDGVFVGEVVVLGIVKGTSFDTGHGTLEATAVAEKFWELHTQRTEMSVDIR
jgi:NADP-dependent 3-hydroxy acid dehydrogenase YdfG